MFFAVFNVKHSLQRLFWGNFPGSSVKDYGDGDVANVKTVVHVVFASVPRHHSETPKIQYNTNEPLYSFITLVLLYSQCKNGTYHTSDILPCVGTSLVPCQWIVYSSVT